MESSRSISPLIDETTSMNIDEPKDWILPAPNTNSKSATPQVTNRKDWILTAPNENSRLATPQDTTCRKRVLLTTRLRTMKTGICEVENIIINYKMNGHTSSVLIQDQLRIHEIYDKEILQLVTSTNEASPQPVATLIDRTAEADDCVIHCPAHRHHQNSNFSIQSGGSISPQTSTSKDS
ncbi:hypothetical protein TNCV_2478971 [Trichonephila clavipes]|nr:hypothetical protein TNCV_2478971 [Trichonephila clavipes]